MCSLNPSSVNFFYLYCVGFGDVSGLNPSMVRLFLSSIKYVHERQCDKARQQAETDRSMKERIANDNVRTSFQSHLFTRHLYRHALFNMSLLYHYCCYCCCYCCVESKKRKRSRKRYADRIDKTDDDDDDNDDDESGSEELYLLLLQQADESMLITQRQYR